MLYHNHAGDMRMVPGLPEPDDPTDRILLVMEPPERGGACLALDRDQWIPILALLRRKLLAHGPRRPGASGS